MSRPQFSTIPGYGDTRLAAVHHQQAVRAGDRVDPPGRGGRDDGLAFPEPVGDEIVRAFENVERTLAEAGTTWRDVMATRLA